MPDPNPIALWSVDRLTPLTLQLARSGLESLLRNGDVVKARVLAMLAGNVAQLEILGQKVEVSTPQALTAGATLSVAVNRTGRGLELVIRPDASGARPLQAPQATGQATAAPTGSAGILQSAALSIEARVLAAQAAINEAVLGAETNFQNAAIASARPIAQPSGPALPPQPSVGLPGAASTLQSLTVSIEDWIAAQAFNEAVLSGGLNSQGASPASAAVSPRQAILAAYSETATDFAPQAHLQAQMRTRYELEALPAAPDPGQEHSLRVASSAQEASQLAQRAAVSSLAPEQRAPNSASAIQVPFQVPQMQQPILLRIEQDEEDQAQRPGRSRQTKRWSVNFSLDTGTIGPVHAGIGYSASALSVRLSSDQAESAFLLSAWLPELKAVLEQADFAVEELSVRDGGLT